VEGEGDAVNDVAEIDDLLAEFTSTATRTLSATEGNSLAQLLPEVYHQLRQLAGSYLRKERPGHTLQPTALVHETYIRLLHQHKVKWEGRAHLLAIAARMMRRILMNHAAARHAEKRGGTTSTRVTLDAALEVFEQREVSAVELHQALQELEKLDPRQGQIVELRFFGGLSVEETAEVLGISPATVKRDWTVAKLWLEREMRRH
jgi:RNA polymerase sigma factor (TIGR02999 family)